MNDLTAFKNQIFKYGIIVTAIFEVVSLPFLGMNLQFFYGLVLGTAIAIVNFNILSMTLKLTLQSGKSSIVPIGYFIRLVIYGVTFYMSLGVSPVSGIGTALGFFSIKAAIYYLHGFKAKFSKGRIVRKDLEDWEPKKHWYDDKED